MFFLSLRKQQHIFIYLSLGINACVLWLRILYLPHSLMYVMLFLIAPPISEIIQVPGLVVFQIVFLFFLVLIVSSFSHASKAFNQYKYKAFIPLAINLFTLIVLLFMQDVVVLPDFYANLQEREAVVAQIASGQLAPNESQRMIMDTSVPDLPYKIYNLTLPPKYIHLSKGRKLDGKINVVIDKKTNRPEMIVFFNSLSMVEDQPNYTAFIYRFNNKLIRQQELFGVNNLTFFIWLLESRRIHYKWFWVELFED